MFKSFYSKFIEANPKTLHFAAHSHHYWPDCTFEAQKQYWLDSAKLVDDKWKLFLGDQKKRCSELILKNIGLDQNLHQQVVFAPNTLELIFRLISSFDWTKDIHILTTPNEFHSFHRLAHRLSEFKSFHIHEVEFENFSEALSKQQYQLVFFSRVFFNSGEVAKNWTNILSNELSAKTSSKTIFCIDDYHGFMALPLDLSPYQNDVFYLAGGYKYAQGGEGACFMYCPSRFKLRPFYTGWFANYAGLDSTRSGQVEYAQDAMAMAGSTLDLSALYRLTAALNLFDSKGISVEKIHSYIQSLQRRFLKSTKLKGFIGDESLESCGHFLTFKFQDTLTAQQYVKKLHAKNVIIDSRGDRVRFGFGLYHDEADVDELLSRI